MAQLNRKNRKVYILGFIFLLIVEILIAKFVNDDFVRPYLGDFLVVILIYCFMMAISKLSVIKTLLFVLVFSFAVEFFQIINIVKVLQYQPPKLVMIMLGSSFSVWDLVAYSLGLLLTAVMEFYFNSAVMRTGK